VAAAVAVLVVNVALPLAIAAYVFWPCVSPQSDAFDSAAWRADAGDGPCGARSAMVDDLEKNHLPAGMAREDVVRTLGPGRPDSDTPFASFAASGDLAYKVGCFIDCNWLVIEFDANDGLRSATVWQD
jgi:hypothetical protein